MSALTDGSIVAGMRCSKPFAFPDDQVRRGMFFDFLSDSQKMPVTNLLVPDFAINLWMPLRKKIDQCPSGKSFRHIDGSTIIVRHASRQRVGQTMNRRLAQHQQFSLVLLGTLKTIAARNAWLVGRKLLILYRQRHLTRKTLLDRRLTQLRIDPQPADRRRSNPRRSDHHRMLRSTSGCRHQAEIR